MDPITAMMIASLGMQATGLGASIFGNNRPSGMSSSIQPAQSKTPFVMPDIYGRQQRESDPRQSVLGTADSLARSMKLPYVPSNYFGQYIRY